jgi:cephalosporin-C deacetylase
MNRYQHRLLLAFLLFACPSLCPAENPATNAAPAAVAAPPKPRIAVTPDHTTGVYKPGETVTWTVDVVGDRSAFAFGVLPFVVKNDGQVEVGHGTVDLTSGPATITASRTHPGVVIAQIFTAPKAGAQPNYNGMPIGVGGAVISPEQIKPSFPAPADFDAFWQSKLKDLAAVPMNPVVEPGDISALKFSENLEYYKVTLNNINGTHVYGQLARPKTGDKFPAMLMVQFAGVYPLDKNQVIAQAKLGWLVLNISAHDLPIDNPPDFYKQLLKTTLADYVFQGCENRDTSYFLRMFLGCARGVDYLTSRPDWNGKVLLVTGGSQGGLQSFVTAALRPKEVTALSADVPAACDIDGPLAKPPRAFGWPYWISNWGPKGRDEKKVAVTAGYYDAINFAARVHCPALVSVGLIDDTARPTGVIAAYNVIPGPKQLLIMPLSDHHGNNNAQFAYYQTFAQWRANLERGQAPPIPK